MLKSSVEGLKFPSQWGVYPTARVKHSMRLLFNVRPNCVSVSSNRLLVEKGVLTVCKRKLVQTATGLEAVQPGGEPKLLPFYQEESTSQLHRSGQEKAVGIFFQIGSVIFRSASDLAVVHGLRRGFVARLAGSAILADAGLDQTVNTDAWKRAERESIAAALKRSGGKVFGWGGAELLNRNSATRASRIKALAIR